MEHIVLNASNIETFLRGQVAALAAKLGGLYAHEMPDSKPDSMEFALYREDWMANEDDKTSYFALAVRVYAYKAHKAGSSPTEFYDHYGEATMRVVPHIWYRGDALLDYEGDVKGEYPQNINHPTAQLYPVWTNRDVLEPFAANYADDVETVCRRHIEARVASVKGKRALAEAKQKYTTGDFDQFNVKGGKVRLYTDYQSKDVRAQVDVSVPLDKLDAILAILEDK